MKDKFYSYSYKENIKPLMTEEQYKKFSIGIIFDTLSLAILLFLIIIFVIKLIMLVIE